MRPWHLTDLTYHHIKDEPPFEVAVLPFGATEPHNLHMPYGTDTIQVEVIADLACEQAWDRGARVVRLPALPFGTETNLKHFPLAMNLNPTTVLAIVTDLLETLADSGIRKALFLNGHGGNDFKWMFRQLYGKTPVHLFLGNWYKMASDHHDAIFDDAGDHAGELETSMGLAHFPELITLEEADPGAMAPTQLEAVNQGWIEITRPWHLLTSHTGAGDPQAASAAKGQELTRIVVDRLADFLQELAALPLSERFPY